MPSEDDRTSLVATRCRQKGPGDSAYSNALGRANVDRQQDLLDGSRRLGWLAPTTSRNT